MVDSKSYNFIIIGGGTVGLVLTNHLSANLNLTVTIIKTGGDVSANLRVLISSLFTAVLESKLN
jgi:Trk K+ transport system NAD-binding subunit